MPILNQIILMQQLSFFGTRSCTLIQLVSVILLSCDSGFLDERPDKALVVPSSLVQAQEILDNFSVMNSSPGLSDISTDDYFVPENTLPALSISERNSYVWKADIFEGMVTGEWNYPYKQIFYSNLVLELVKSKVFAAQKEDMQALEGSALFYRSMAYFQLLGLFAPSYTPGANDAAMGVPLRLSSRVDQAVSRNNLKSCYAQIISDLERAVELLPNIATIKSRPSKVACYALLARIHLFNNSYKEALVASEFALQIQNQLIDYSLRDLNPNVAAFPAALPSGNPEVIFHTFKINYSYASGSTAYLDTSISNSYHQNDLRKKLFLQERGNGAFTFRGSYNGTRDSFAGLAVDELYLISAEAFVRTGQVEKALEKLNFLLLHRFEKGTFRPIVSSDSNEVLKLILLERRKELVSRCLRWADLRRLNKEKITEVTLSRRVGKELYVLLPADRKYVFPIPEYEILSSHIEQNNRE